MSRGIKIAIIAVIAVIVLAGIMFLIWALVYKPPVFFPSEQTTPAIGETEEEPGLPPATGTVITEVQPGQPAIGGGDFLVSTPKDAQEQQVKNLSVLFVERFGSYSNQGNFENVTDLMPLMTRSMQSWAENYVKANQVDPDGDYYGISTKVVSTRFSNLDIEGGIAEATLETQRRENGTGLEERVFMQNVEIEIIKFDGQWLINQLEWQ